MKKNWKLTLFTVAILTVILACSLPTATPPASIDDPAQPPPTNTPVEEPDPLPQPEPEEPEAEEPQDQQDPEESCIPDSEYIEDITIPDGTLVNPGNTITKTWRIHNDGECTWTSEYVWEQLNFEDSKLKASIKANPLSTDIAPGQTLDISVELTLAGGAAIGSRHIARFQMRDPEGNLFGTHPFSAIFASPGTGVCPIGDANQKTFINPAEMFCFLYPKDYKAYVGGMGHTYARAPGTPGVNEEILASVSISNEGDTGGLNTNQWADQMINAWKAPATTPTVTDVEVGGMTARQTDELPGMVGNRIVFLVYNGDGYVFTILPIDDSFPVKKQDAFDLWSTVRNSFTFFGP